MGSSFDLTRTPLRDPDTVALGRRVSNLVTGFLATMVGITSVFYFLDAQRWGATYAAAVVPVVIGSLALIPLCRLEMRVLIRQAVRLDISVDGVMFHLDDKTSRFYPWRGSARRLTWVDGRGGHWPKLRAGWPKTSVHSQWGPLAILPEEAFDGALAIARSQGLQVQRQKILESLPAYRGNAIYRVVTAD